MAVSQWNASKPALANQISADVPDIEENFEELQRIIETITNGTLGTTDTDSYSVDKVLSPFALGGTNVNATAAEINTACDLTVNGFFTTGNVNKMIFYLDTAPTGMSIDTTLDDKLVFVTKGSVAGGQTGGGAHSTGSWTISGLTADAHTHTGPSHTHTGPSHAHTVDIWASDKAGTILSHTSEYNVYLTDVGGDRAWFSQTASIASAGRGKRETTAASGTGATGASGTGATGTASTDGITSDATWRPAAYCCIIASLD